MQAVPGAQSRYVLHPMARHCPGLPLAQSTAGSAEPNEQAALLLHDLVQTPDRHRSPLLLVQSASDQHEAYIVCGWQVVALHDHLFHPTAVGSHFSGDSSVPFPQTAATVQVGPALQRFVSWQVIVRPPVDVDPALHL
jgi:hypothetical protein